MMQFRGSFCSSPPSKYARMYLSVILKWELCVLSVWGQNLGSARLTMSWACTALDTRRRRSTRPCSTSTELPTVYMYIFVLISRIVTGANS